MISSCTAAPTLCSGELLEARDGCGLHGGEKLAVLDRDEAPCLRVAGAGRAGRQLYDLLDIRAGSLLVQEAAHAAGVTHDSLKEVSVTSYHFESFLQKACQAAERKRDSPR